MALLCKETQLFGFEAIIAHDGIEISIIGISIVFVSLILLSIAVSQIHKLIRLWDKRTNYYRYLKKPKQDQKTLSTSNMLITQEVQRSSRQFKLLIEWLGEPFPLPKLLYLAGKCGLFRPHSTINALVQCKLIIPDGKGYFIWNRQLEEKRSSI